MDYIDIVKRAIAYIHYKYSEPITVSDVANHVYLSSSHFYLGILINFICIFLICYTLVSPYDMTFYKPFVMLYVFAQYSSISIDYIPNRFLAVIFGVFIIVIFRRLLNKDKESKIFFKPNKNLGGYFSI